MLIFLPLFISILLIFFVLWSYVCYVLSKCLCITDLVLSRWQIGSEVWWCLPESLLATMLCYREEMPLYLHWVSWENNPCCMTRKCLKTAPVDSLEDFFAWILGNYINFVMNLIYRTLSLNWSENKVLGCSWSCATQVMNLSWSKESVQMMNVNLYFCSRWSGSPKFFVNNLLG